MDIYDLYTNINSLTILSRGKKDYLERSTEIIKKHPSKYAKELDIIKRFY